MRLPPRYNPGRPRPGMQQPIPRGGIRPPLTVPGPDGTPIRNPILNLINPVRPGVQQPIKNISDVAITPFNSTPVGPRQIQQPGTQPVPRDFGFPRGPFQSNVTPLRPMQQQAPLQQQAFSYGGRAGYQMGGIMGLETGQEEPIFPRLETLSENLGQAEQTLGEPSNDQFNASSITTAITGRPQMNKGGSPEEEMENIKEFYYGRRRGEMEDLLDEYERFKMRKDFLRRYPRDEARFGGRMGYPKTGIGSLANRQGYFLGGVGDFVGDIVGGIGDVVGGIADVGGDILGGVGDVLGDLDLGQLMQIYQVAAPFVGLPPIPGGEMSFLPGGIPGGEGGIGSLLQNFGSFMPQGETSGFNPYQFASNLIMNQTQQGDQTGGGNTPMDTISIITNLLRKFLTPEGIAGTTATTVGKLTFDEIKRLNRLREEEFKKYKEGSARKRTQYRTAEGRETLPGYEVTGVPQTTADVFRAPAMKGGIMNVPTGQIRRNPFGVKEIDYRQSGGFVPPIGVKEKADDIPAMLSNNEFVFTADAVRAAGGGSVNKGAQKMYSLMKQLEGRS